MAEPEKCSHETGPCKLMAKFARGGADTSPRAKGIFAFDNLVNTKDPTAEFHHAGFFFRDPDTTGTRGVMLNFCPWCGGDLEAWTEAALAKSGSVRETG
jgi:hypothetical protein